MNFEGTPNKRLSAGVLIFELELREAVSLNSEEASNGALSSEDLEARG